MTEAWTTRIPTALLVLADGTVIEGDGLGATGIVEGEVCFNTALTGYQEILTDPSYSRQIVTFTFPHIGNVGANEEDAEDLVPANACGAVGAIFRAEVSTPSNYRSSGGLDAWLKKRGVIALSGIDTRALTAHIRERGAPNAVIAHDPNGVFDVEALKARARAWSGLVGLDLAKDVAVGQSVVWNEKAWVWNEGFAREEAPRYKIVAIDYGTKRNILRLMSDRGAEVILMPATATAEEVMAHHPDGVFLSNGPGDPEATGDYAVPTIQGLMETGVPMFGICLGHQMLALALGGKTEKMHQGHHGANHPVMDHTTGKVEIVSMNHGFAVESASLPSSVEETHISLFDQSNCGLRVRDKPIFSVQHHPEASPGPQDSHYLFDRFFQMIDEKRAGTA
ncbi:MULTISPECIES: glutamine-hydrolyzing carbamoyl-phosphate synthase small subunit [unclassified Aureimonas]|uniref:glutamine-hydrolyzing carbamoyl-phosphate synthase small subunit n=1 Tax=unclassified Aureimonas TaxID=2615206 RepID=UPI0006F6BA7C|nr:MULTISPECIES: glutamine-hydrolyzing carbamoyl-phosphate synthase small subunit [unclassified Aureimonas]KQT69608.1 carbamoyl phosphate synthase small subunit [Aureimonas sp. Leaf427]KQT80959.1 carbamoyl phosphate synthase small subunit [Aureimonas sp. Leaf460]